MAWATALVLGASSPALGFDLQGAIERAEPGERVRVPAGTYDAPVTIRKPLTLVAEDGARIAGGGEGDVVRVEAPDVTVRGFRISGSGDSLDREHAGIEVTGARARIVDNAVRDALFGIYLKKAPESVVENNTVVGKKLPIGRRGDGIRVWYSNEARIVGNRMDRSRDLVMWFSDGVTIVRNEITRSRYGLHFMYSDGNRIRHNTMRGNAVGAFLMYSSDLVLEGNAFVENHGESGYGVGVKDVDGLRVTANRFVGNDVGLYNDNSPSQIDIEHVFRKNVFAYNNVGLSVQPLVENNVFTENTFLANVEQVAIRGDGRLEGNVFAVDGKGNYWSDYAGYDGDGDGVGETAYRAESLYEALLQDAPVLRFLRYSPAAEAIELVARAVPAFRPEPRITDPAPLTRPVWARAAPTTGSGVSRAASGIAGAGGALLALGALAVLLGARAARGPRRGRATEHARAADRPVVSIRGLRKRYGRVTAVSDIDLAVASGEALALWGPNGAGKSTVIRCLMGLLRCRGAIEVAGLSIARRGKAARRQVGFVPQELAFHEDWRVEETLALEARLKRVSRDRIDAVIEEVGLSEKRRARVGALSGGMKQRLALAGALLAEPPLLVLDEVTAHLDAESRRGFLRLLEAQRERGRTILFSSHRIGDVCALADRVACMAEGRIRATCRPDELSAGSAAGVLRLVVEPARGEEAASALRAAGYSAEAIHCGVVRVSPRDGEKAGPFAALVRAGVPARDFEVGPAEEEKKA